MARRSFSSKRKQVAFDVDGEEFDALTVPGALFVDFMRKAGDPETTEAEMGTMLYDIFSSLLDESSFERFWNICRTSMDIDGMMEILSWLATASSNGRPTVPSSPSASGRRRAAGAAGSSDPVSKLKASTSVSSAT